jgi:hypothetical protein
MNRKFAYFLSVILHPVWMPTYALLFIFQNSTFFTYSIPQPAKLALFLIIVLNTLIFPALLSYVLLKKGVIRSFEMEKREERLIPYASNLLLLMVAAYLIHSLRLPQVFFQLILGAIAGLTIAIIINLKWKISIHMIGIGAMTGTLFGLSTFLMVDLRYPIILALLVSGLLGSARYYLGAHNQMQIYSGFLIGFFCEFVLLSL